MRWEPWEDFKTRPADVVVPLPIQEPPCKACRYWRPEGHYDREGRLRDVRCCHYGDLPCHDFSCYRPKE